MLTVSNRWWDHLKWSVPVFATVLLVACMQRAFFPVSVEGVALSPVYQLRIVNQTSQTLTFQPIRKFRSHYSPMTVEPGGSIQCLVQVNKIKVGETFTREAVAGPYIDSGRLGPDLADIRYRDSGGIKRDIAIDLSHPSWFDAYTVRRSGGEALPKTITISLTDENLFKRKWFARGPNEP